MFASGNIQILPFPLIEMFSSWNLSSFAELALIFSSSDKIMVYSIVGLYASILVYIILQIREFIVAHSRPNNLSYTTLCMWNSCTPIHVQGTDDWHVLHMTESQALAVAQEFQNIYFILQISFNCHLHKLQMPVYVTVLCVGEYVTLLKYTWHILL